MWYQHIGRTCLFLSKRYILLYRFLHVFINWRECLLGTWNYLKLQLQKVPANSVLLVEPNETHGEILPGYAKYYQDLGYEVFVLTRYRNYHENSFCRYDNPPKLYCLTIWGTKQYLLSKKRHLYKNILVTSSRPELKEYNIAFKLYSDFLGLNYENEDNMYYIEHGVNFLGDMYMENKDKPDSRIYKLLFNKTYVLTGFQFNGHWLPELNPCYWGNVKINKKTNSDKKLFVVIGRDYVRDYQALYDAIEALPEDVPYEVQAIGWGIWGEMSEKCRRHIKVMGRLNFEKMYQCMERADFFLPLLNEKNPIHAEYLKACTTGSRQLILGFCKIPVIKDIFARHYGFDETNSLIYQDNFVEVMRKALLMDDEKYASMVQSLKKEYERVYQKSLNTLKCKLQNRE